MIGESAEDVVYSGTAGSALGSVPKPDLNQIGSRLNKLGEALTEILGSISQTADQCFGFQGVNNALQGELKSPAIERDRESLIELVTRLENITSKIRQQTIRF